MDEDDALLDTRRFILYQRCYVAIFMRNRCKNFDESIGLIKRLSFLHAIRMLVNRFVKNVRAAIIPLKVKRALMRGVNEGNVLRYLPFETASVKTSPKTQVFG